VVDAPAEGCAPRIAQVESDRISQVVYEVMSVLEKRGVF